MSVMKFKLCKLNNRSLISLNGRDAFSYIQSFITGDLRKASPAVNGVMLNASGKILSDVMVYVLNGNPSRRQLTLSATTYERFGIDGQDSDSLLVECDSQLAIPVRDTFFCFKIRRKVAVSQASEYNLFSLYLDPKSIPQLTPGNLPLIENLSSNDIIISQDPRIGPFNYRVLSRLGHNSVDAIMNLLSHHVPYSMEGASLSEYQKFRYLIGMAEGASEFKPCYLHPLDCNVDYMNGFSLQKGQFTGKDAPSRRKIKSSNLLRLMPIEFLLPPGHTNDSMKSLNFGWNTEVTDRCGRIVGKLLKRNGQQGLAFLNLRRVISNDFLLLHRSSGYYFKTWLPFWWPRSAYLPYFDGRRELLPLPQISSSLKTFSKSP